MLFSIVKVDLVLLGFAGSTLGGSIGLSASIQRVVNLCCGSNSTLPAISWYTDSIIWFPSWIFICFFFLWFFITVNFLYMWKRSRHMAKNSMVPKTILINIEHASLLFDWSRSLISSVLVCGRANLVLVVSLVVPLNIWCTATNANYDI